MQGSPTLRALSRETYRHALAVTAVRPGLDGTPFLYTLNMSCPQDLWDDVQPGFAQGVASFRHVEAHLNLAAACHALLDCVCSVCACIQQC